MPELKLGKLPDRRPVKITITVSPELSQALRHYAEVYRTTCGDAESVSELIPFMLSAFLDGDRGFAKARRDVALDVLPEPERRRGRRRSSSPAPDRNPED